MAITVCAKLLVAPVPPDGAPPVLVDEAPPVLVDEAPPVLVDEAPPTDVELAPVVIPPALAACTKTSLRPPQAGANGIAPASDKATQIKACRSGV